MTTKTFRPSVLALLLATSLDFSAQWAGFNPEQLTAPAAGVIVGTGGLTANLTVNGHQMSAASVNQFDTYGTFNSATGLENETRWRLHRVSDASGTPREIGRIFAAAETTGSLNNGFQIKQMEANAALWLKNVSNNGIRLIDDVTTTVNGYTSMNTREGYMAVGRINILPGGTVNAMSAIDAPWSRVHLVHQAGPDAPEGWRPHMRNGVLGTGNNDLAYVGQMFDMTLLLDGEPVVKSAVKVGR